MDIFLETVLVCRNTPCAKTVFQQVQQEDGGEREKNKQQGWKVEGLC